MALPKSVRVIVPTANIRNAPIIASSSDIGDITQNSMLDVIGETDAFWETKTYVAKSVVESIFPPPPPTIIEWQVHPDTKCQPQWRGIEKGVPMVYHTIETASTPLTEELQWFIFYLNQRLSPPGFAPIMWRKLASWDRAFTNGTGYGNPNGNHYADFINQIDLDCPLPVNDKCRMCPMILHGIESNGILHIETLRADKELPTIEEVVKKPWLWFKAITIAPDGKSYNFPQAAGRPIYWPLLSKEPVTVKINNCEPKPIPYVTKI